MSETGNDIPHSPPTDPPSAQRLKHVPPASKPAPPPKPAKNRGAKMVSVDQAISKVVADSGKQNQHSGAAIANNQSAVTSSQPLQEPLQKSNPPPPPPPPPPPLPRAVNVSAPTQTHNEKALMNFTAATSGNGSGLGKNDSYSEVRPEENDDDASLVDGSAPSLSSKSSHSINDGFAVSPMSKGRGQPQMSFSHHHPPSHSESSKVPSSVGAPGTGVDPEMRSSKKSMSSELSREFSRDTISRDTISRDTLGPTAPRKQGLQPGEPLNPVYHLVRYSVGWMVALLLIHTGQFTLLLTVGYRALSSGAFAVVLLLVLAVAVLMLASRWFVTKSHMSKRRNVALRGGVCTPADEADDVPDKVVYMIAAAAVLEGVALAVFSAASSGRNTHLSNDGFYTRATLLQTLRFASITLLALHRTLRPANRLDPLRTIMELEIVSVCWDALDGSTLYELLDDSALHLGASLENAVRTLMAFWYFSVGVRMAMVFLTHLTPSNSIYHWVTTYPFELDPQPTVDRTLQGLRLRSVVTIAMAFADLYAGSIRLHLWIHGQLDSLQQDMCIKNFLFLATVGFAFANFRNTTTRNWNKRTILDSPVVLKRPRREWQMEFCRWGFAAAYLLVGLLLTLILARVTASGTRWVGNLVLDVLLVGVFLLFCKNVHVHEPTNQLPACFLLPHKSFFAFPGRLALGMSVVLGISLLAARLPALYFHYSSLAGGGGGLYSYDTAMLIVVLSLLPMGLFAGFWTTAYMVFRKEFTASPGNYNAIHDPSIKLVAMSAMTEGALDVLSCAQLMQLAQNGLPAPVSGAVVLFCLLEMVNGCQSFALNIMLSGGHDDTPKDLIRWNAYLRVARGVIDFGTIVLRLVLWVRFNAISSVFLVKNLYNLIHTGSQIERYSGTSYYPKGTMFSEFVPPADWYGMSKGQWRAATRDTVAAQAQAGRGV